MQEKIKISLPTNVLNTLKLDCKNFNIVKADGTPNFNSFINTLIVNFYEGFTANEETSQDEISKIVSILPDRYRETIFNGVIKAMAKRNSNITDKNSSTFSFKPTKSSEKAVSFIENIILANESLSSFYRRLFISYTSRPQPKREIIIFKENYDLLQKAIKKGVQVCIVTKGDRIKNTSIYAVASAKEELYNYILSSDEQDLYTLRLANVKSVSLLSKKAETPNDVKEIFERQIRCGVQYPIYRDEDQLIKVIMSNKGLYLYKKIYLYRPDPIKIEGNVFFFDCSVNQAMHYFKRFGVDAIIVEPEKIAKMMYTYYAGATRKYLTAINLPSYSISKDTIKSLKDKKGK